MQATVTSAQVAKQAVHDAYGNRNGNGPAYDLSREGTYLDPDNSTEHRNFASNTKANTSRNDDHFDIENAALSLEVMAGGGGGLADDEEPVDLKPFIPGLNETKEQFSASSIVITDFDNGIEGNPRLPYLAYSSRANLVEQIIAYVQGSHRTLPLINLYFDTIGFVFNVSAPLPSPQRSGRSYIDVQVIRHAPFMREHEAFWMMANSGERRFDPAWLAQLCIILAVALQAKEEWETPQFQTEDLYLLSKACIDVSIEPAHYKALLFG